MPTVLTPLAIGVPSGRQIIGGTGIVVSPGGGLGSADQTISLASGVLPSAKLFCGDGSDGTVSISSGTTTLTRDMYYDVLNLANGAIIDTAGFVVHVKTSLNGPASGLGTIRRNGAAAASNVPGTGFTSAQGTLQTDSGDGAGATFNNGAQATAVARWPTSFRAGVGGAGGNGTAGKVGGAAGLPAAALQLDTVGSLNNLFAAIRGRFFTSNSSAASGGGGGSSGGGSGAAAGGAGGAGGGYVVVLAASVTNAANLAITADGGAGGGGGSACGGGGGGGGGYVVILVGQGSFPATITANGGAGGANGGAGAVNGSAGGAGQVMRFGG